MNHKQRVKLLHKHKGEYLEIPVRSKRHANQIRLAISDAGIKFDPDKYWTTWRWGTVVRVIYSDGMAGLYTGSATGGVKVVKVG